MSGAASVRIAVVLHQPDDAGLARFLESVDVGVRQARDAGLVGDATVQLGDCSSDHRERTGHDMRYVAFGENLWHSGGVNRLLADLDEDVAVLLNPDLLVLPDAIGRLVQAVVGDDQVAIADARQLPFEHPKPHDAATGDAPWASMAACAIRREAWEQVGPLDADWFPMHGNDVDFSWRARLAGWRVRHVPEARVFHDKRLTPSGAVAPSEVEEEHGARAALLLAVKYSRPDVAERYFALLESGTPAQRRGAEAVRALLARGPLPTLLDPDHRVAEFVGGDFAEHRF